MYIKLDADISSTESANDFNFYLSSSFKFNVTLDLAGHSLSRKSRTIDNAMFFIGSNTTLTIYDSVGNGNVNCNLDCGNSNSRMFCVSSGGELIINGGTFETLRNTTYGEYCVDVVGGTVTLKRLFNFNS